MTERKNKRSKEAPREQREELKPITSGHANYIRCMVENHVTFCIGPAGSSKSYTALGLACQYLLSGKVERIIIARPAIEAAPAGKGLGFLPGDMNKKLDPYVRPAVEHMQAFLGRNSYGSYLNNGSIIIEAMEYLRGRTFNNAFIIGEEFQNCTTKQIKMFASRLGKGSKMVINGDTDQADLYSNSEDYPTDLEYVISLLDKYRPRGFAVHELTNQDIVRHEILGPFLDMFNKRK